MKGKVWLIGAGPGDAGLLTQKAADVLKEADVIVYDALVSLEILCQLPPSTRKIHVGKRAGHHSTSQEAINQLLIDEALQGNQVARLKGGDPFVFGRGGEELELLVENEIPYEIIPGITSAIAAPAYAGIPVTHRAYTSSFHVITGHAKTGNEDRTDYAALVQMNATLIFLMGVGQLSHICSRLIEEGMDPETPAAIVENGTLNCQRQLLSTVQCLADEAEEKAFHAPSVIVIGKVAGLMDAFSWLSSLPLAGYQCIVTRPKSQSSQLTSLLRQKGAHVLELPAIEIQTDFGCQEEYHRVVQDICSNFFEENWIVLMSPSDVEVFFQLLMQSEFDLRSLGQRTRWAVIGSRTAEELKKHGIQADLIPENANRAALAKKLQKSVGVSSKVFIFKGNQGSSIVAETMASCGIPCEELVIYQTHIGMDIAFAGQVLEEARKPGTVVMFTSASCVEGFVQTLGKTEDYTKIQAICVGPQTAEKAMEYHMQTLTAKTASIEGMVDMIDHTIVKSEES